MDSLYRGYPSGSLLFWETDMEPGERELSIGGQAKAPWKAPMYLIDGQQRLTSLYRVFSDHAEAQIVYNVDLDQFKNQTATSRSDPKWIKVFEVLKESTSLYSLTDRLSEAGCTTAKDGILDRLTRLRKLHDYRFHIEILRDIEYRAMADIFVRVNSGGEHLNTIDLTLAMLSADWPGMLSKLQAEAASWRKRGYSDIDVVFLSRALAAAMGHSLGSLKPGRIPMSKLDQAWSIVQRGVKHVVKLLAAHLRLTRSDVMPSPAVLIPLIILLGERPDGPLGKQNAEAIIYWFLVATIGDRYSGASETKLAQDVKAARRPKAIEALLQNLPSQPKVTPEYLKGRTKESRYFFLSLLVTHLNEARDWWDETTLMNLAGDQRMEHHHVHPIATLEEKYEKAEINDLANLVFISGKANRRISNKSPRAYFPEVGEHNLRAHFIPLDESLRDTERYMDFLDARRQLLSDAMNALLDKFRPDWLDQLPMGKPSETDGLSMRLVLYASAWDPGRVVFTATSNGAKWSAAASMGDLESAITAAGVAGISGDVEIGGESVPVEIVEGAVQLPVGPFILTGAPEEWEQVFERERAAARSLATLVPPAESSWNGAERVPFPVTSTD
jgi:hypothetical protein